MDLVYTSSVVSAVDATCSVEQIAACKTAGKSPVLFSAFVLCYIVLNILVY